MDHLPLRTGVHQHIVEFEKSANDDGEAPQGQQTGDRSDEDVVMRERENSILRTEEQAEDQVEGESVSAPFQSSEGPGQRKRKREGL